MRALSRFEWFRCWLAGKLVTVAYHVAVPEIRMMIGAHMKMVQGIGEQVALGRDGGVSVIPWSYSANGAELAERQMASVMPVLANVRYHFEQERG